MFKIFNYFVSFNMESFKYNVFESELLFSVFFNSWHGFFTRVPLFKALPRYVHDVIQSYNYYLIKAQIRSLHMVAVASTFLCILYRNGRLKSSKKNNSMKYLEQRPLMAIFVFSVTISAQEHTISTILDREHSCFLVFKAPLNMSEKNVNHVHRWKVTSTTGQVLSQVCINLVLNV